MTETPQTPSAREGLDARQFISQLQQLVPRQTPTGEKGGDRAALAALRRGLDKVPGESWEAFAVIYSRIPEDHTPLPPWEEPIVFLVSSLFALYQPQPPHGEWRGNLGDSLRLLDSATESNGPERRLVALLNSDDDDLSHHLRGIINLLKSADPPIPVDWVQLTNDLLHWSLPNRPVQRRWASAFWGGRQIQETNAESTDDQEPS